MAGALLHLVAGLICAVIVHRKHLKLEFSNAIFIGNLLPDVVKFGVSSIFYNTLDTEFLVRTPIFSFIGPITNNINTWIILSVFILAFTFFLYHYHFIKKKKMREYSELVIFLLIGIIVHIIFDFIFSETGVWF